MKQGIFGSCVRDLYFVENISGTIHALITPGAEESRASFPWINIGYQISLEMLNETTNDTIHIPIQIFEQKQY